MQSPRFEESLGSDLRAALLLLKAKLWVIVSCVLAGGVAAAIYIAHSPRTYTAQAVIQAVIPTEQEEQKVLRSEPSDAQEIKGEEIAKTIEQSLTSPELLINLITQAELNKDEDFLPSLKRPVSDSKLAEELTKRIFAQVRRGTRLIDVRVEDRSPVMAQKIADLLVKQFIKENFARHVEAAQGAYDFFLRQADRLRMRLAKSEEALQTYKEQHGTVSFGE